MPEKKSLKILLAVDGSPHSEAAMRLATGMLWPAGTSVTVLVVAPERWSLLGLGPETQSLVAEMMTSTRRVDWAAAETLATQAAERLHTHGLAVAAEVREGQPSEVILERAADLPADLVVIGAKGLSAPGEFRLGATAHKLAHYAECSVLVARPLERAQPLSVILAADGSPEAQRAADLVCVLSLPRWAEVTVTSVVEVIAGFPIGEGHPIADMPEAVRRTLLDAAEARAADVVRRLAGCGGQVCSATRLGHPAGEILAAARAHDADLIVVGARGQTRAAPFRLGGIAQKVVKYAPCSVLVVR